MTAYSRNRIGALARQRVVVNLPPELVRQIDEWGVAEGMRSRRETTEVLLKEALVTREHTVAS